MFLILISSTDRKFDQMDCISPYYFKCGWAQSKMIYPIYEHKKASMWKCKILYVFDFHWSKLIFIHDFAFNDIPGTMLRWGLLCSRTHGIRTKGAKILKIWTIKRNHLPSVEKYSKMNLNKIDDSTSDTTFHF